jgi:hypothetical protein
VLSTVVVAVGVGVLVWAITIGLPRLIRQAWRPFADCRRAHTIAASLAAGVQIDHFTELLGSASFKHHVDQYVDYSFVRRLFYVQAVSDHNGRVVLFTITTRSKHFTPRLGFTGGHPTLSIRLGKTHFADAASASASYHAFLGARRFDYWESHYFGYPGRYQSYFLGLSDAGFLRANSRVDLLRSLSTPSLPDFERPGNLTTFRETAAVNSYGETAPHVDADVMFKLVGVDKDRVRVVN